MFTTNDLRTLMGRTARPAVSIFLPTHVRGREIRQDPIRLKNLLSEAEAQLVARGQRAEAVRDMLEPARELVDDGPFWRHQDQGLALFLAPGVFHRYHVPLALAEGMFIGPSFHIRPLLNLLAVDGRFLVLTISNARTRLFECSRFNLTERTDLDVPHGVEAIAQETEYQEMLDANPFGRKRAGMQGGVQGYQSVGEDPEQVRKTQQIEYLRRVAAGVDATLGSDDAPVVLAAESQIRGHFNKISGLDPVSELELNPDAFEPGELHRLAFEKIRPHLLDARRRALDQFNTLLGNNDPRAGIRVEDIVKGARYARVEMLFVADGEHLWGRFDERTGQVTVHGRPNGDDCDLLDYAAAQTLLNGGRVDLLPRAEMPRGALATAIFRY
ncbi:MAG TPA: hypothetical protein VF342_08270 [Alphaproteobacteria bacterium]